MKPHHVILALLVLLLGFVGGYGYGRWYGPRNQAAAPGGRKILYYVDPMHPAYKSDKPGIAPDCGMKLEPVYADSAPPAPPSAASRKVLYYRDPQAPDFKSDRAGLNPETGDELEPVYEDGGAPAGLVNIRPDRQQLIGVRYGTVTQDATGGSIRALGRIVPDERRIARVHPRIDGWIHTLHVAFTGQLVKKGEPLLTIYSPDMLATEQEFLLALKARDAMQGNRSPEASENSETMLEASRKRMQLWDLSNAQITAIEQTRRPLNTVTLYSPAAGFVTARNAFPSQRVTPETELYAITDLSHVWILADVFETDLDRIRRGMMARVTVPAENGREFSARVTYIQPQLDPATRTLKVRLEAPNPDLRLKPDMFVNVQFRTAAAAHLTVPAEAVLDSGMRKTVFVDRGNGFLEPREVQTGDRTGDRIEIRSGLKAGDRIVTSGNFLIDSESQLSGTRSAPDAGKKP